MKRVLEVTKSSGSVRYICVLLYRINVLELNRGRKAEERDARTAARPSDTEMNTRSKRRLEALSRRYPGKLELRVHRGGHACHPAYAGAITAARFDDLLAHVTFTVLRSAHCGCALFLRFSVLGFLQ